MAKSRMPPASMVRLGRIVSGSVRSIFLSSECSRRNVTVNTVPCDHPVFECGGARAGGLAALQEAARLGEHERVGQRSLGGETPVEGRAADAAAAGDVFHRGASHPDQFGLLERGCQDPRGDLVGIVELGDDGRVMNGIETNSGR